MGDSSKQEKKTAWEKLADTPFAGEIIADLRADVTAPVLRSTQHATLMAEGRRELAIELLMRIGDM